MEQSVMNDVGKLILRLAVGVLILLHGVQKVTDGIAGVQGLLASMGLPGWFAYGVYVGEVVAPILLILGYYGRLGAALIAGNMLVAIGLAHPGDVLALTRTGGWAIELQAMFLFSAVALVLLGPGRLSLDRH
jgi:putative oxidoreductase